MSEMFGSFSEAWVHMLMDLDDGDVTSRRGMVTREERWSQFAVGDPLSFPVEVFGRKLRNVIGVLEACSLVGQFSIPELFTSRVPKFLQFLDDGVFHGAYSTRAHGAVGDVVRLLERDPDSRQAVISVFDSGRDLDRQKRDIPCTIALHFMVRGDELEMNVTMRSNDIWLGTPYDFVQFGVLQATVAQALGLKPGVYVHSAGSLHLYERDLEAAQKVEGFALKPSQDFPLWHSESGSIGSLSKRARDLAIGDDFIPVTGFEAWAWTELHG
jgi:thymidylate synthase